MWQTLSHSLTSPRLFAPRKAYVGVVIGVYFFTFSVSCYFPFPLYSFSSLLLAQRFFSRSALFPTLSNHSSSSSSSVGATTTQHDSNFTPTLVRVVQRNTINLNVLEIRFILLLYFTASSRSLSHSLPSPFFPISFHIAFFFFFSLLNTSLQVSDMNTQNIFKHTREPRVSEWARAAQRLTIACGGKEERREGRRRAVEHEKKMKHNNRRERKKKSFHRQKTQLHPYMRHKHSTRKLFSLIWNLCFVFFCCCCYVAE